MTVPANLTVWNTTRATTTSVLRSISTTANVINNAAASLDAFAETGAAYAQSYRDDAIETLAATQGHRRTIRVLTAKRDTARELRALEEELRQDPDLFDVFNRLKDSDFEPQPKA